MSDPDPSIEAPLNALEPEVFELASAFMDAGDYGRAEAVYSELLARRGDRRIAALRGHARYCAGLFQQALEDFDLALSARPQAPATLVARAGCKAALGDEAGATRDLELAATMISSAP